ncbi:hypothetical protein [Streptomyces sp. NPDC048473]|uniref:hypothetical protein n=1 Tax=Streptomyces sp. NPDC048473 TaxID=3365556 RepID=UPI003717DC8F
MSIVSERVVRVLRAGLAEEIERQIEEDNARGPEPEARVLVSSALTVLELVLRTHGESCRCEGACGTEHPGRMCREDGTPKEPLIAAPYPLPCTEHETVAASVEALRPWCAPCWRKAKKRTTELAAELRRQQLDEAQTALPMDLFGGGR